MVEKVRTLVGSAVAWAVATVAVLSGLSALLLPYAHVPVVAKVVAVLTAVVGSLSAAVAAVSRVTPVPETVRGLTPQHPLDVAWAIADEYGEDETGFWDRVELAEPDE